MPSRAAYTALAVARSETGCSTVLIPWVEEPVMVAPEVAGLVGIVGPETNGHASCGSGVRASRFLIVDGSVVVVMPRKRRELQRLRVGRLCGAVLLVGDVLAPGDGAAALVVLLHGDVGHEAVRRGAVPVVLAGLEEHAVAGADDLDRPALALAPADALGDEDRLAVRMGVPGGAGAGREVHERGGERRGASRRGDGVDVDVAGEPVAGALLGVGAAAGDLHETLAFGRERSGGLAAVDHH